jgi:hypothetical protein
VLEDYEAVSWLETITDLNVDGENVTRTVGHSYAGDSIPKGITPPVDAVSMIQTRRKLNPSYDPASDYTPREDRAEWDTVGLMGKLRIRKGQVTGAGWIKMRDVSADVEEWLVK